MRSAAFLGWWRPFCRPTFWHSSAIFRFLWLSQSLQCIQLITHCRCPLPFSCFYFVQHLAVNTIKKENRKIGKRERKDFWFYSRLYWQRLFMALMAAQLKCPFPLLVHDCQTNPTSSNIHSNIEFLSFLFKRSFLNFQVAITEVFTIRAAVNGTTPTILVR